jgi:hypothetical protein
VLATDKKRSTIILSDEMMIQTPDSSAGASDGYGAAGAILDAVREAADSEYVSTNGVNDSADVPADYFADDDTLGYLSEQASDTSEPGPIPYDRFREVNDKYKNSSDRLSKWDDVIQQFEQQGYQSAEDVQRALAQQEQQAQEQAIRQRYHDLTQQELVDPNTAQLQLEAELTSLRYKQAMAEMNQFMAQREREEAVQRYPLAQKAGHIVDRLITTGVKPSDAVKMVHELTHGLQQSMRQEVTQQVNQGQRTPTPVSQASSASAVVGGTQQNTTGRRSLSSLLGIRQG